MEVVKPTAEEVAGRRVHIRGGKEATGLFTRVYLEGDDGEIRLLANVEKVEITINPRGRNEACLTLAGGRVEDVDGQFRRRREVAVAEDPEIDLWAITRPPAAGP